MRWLGGVLGAVLLATVLWDAFRDDHSCRGGSAGGSAHEVVLPLDVDPVARHSSSFVRP